jgi:hypothetical protein
MPSEKLARILKSKSLFSAKEIETVSEAAGWTWVYANAAPRREKLPQVCFTGFTVPEKLELAALAGQSGLKIVTHVTKHLAFLCAARIQDL